MLAPWADPHRPQVPRGDGTGEAPDPPVSGLLFRRRLSRPVLIRASASVGAYLNPPCRNRCSAQRSSTESRVQTFPSPEVQRLHVMHPVSCSQPRLSIST